MKSFLKFLFISLLSACSFSASSSDNPAVREVLITLSNRYLINVVNGNFGELNSLVQWDEYLGNKRGSFSKKKYFEQLSSLDGRYEIENHPLLSLELVDTEIDENNAQLNFKKKNSATEVNLTFMWVENGWLIVNDNLFAVDGLFSHLKPLTDKQKNKLGKVRQSKLNPAEVR